MTIDETIAARKSCRSYDSQALQELHRNQLETAVRNDSTDHLGRPVSLKLIERESTPESASSGGAEKLGTYGVVKGAVLFLAGSFPRNDPKIESYGYAFEKIVLKATELGIGSCWLAGTLDRGAFGRALGLRDDAFMPAISPLGYPADKRFFMDKVFRFAAGSDKRLAWDELFSDADGGKPLTAETAGAYAKALEAVRWAPSASNKQPWRISRLGGGYRFFVKRTPGYGKPFSFDLQRSDIGIAMCHFELSARAAGLQGRWAYEDSPLRKIEEAEYIISWLPEGIPR